MKKYFQIGVIIFTLIFMINLGNVPSNARAISLLDKNITIAKVVEVISGEAIKAIEYDKVGNKKIILIKMIGIDTESSQEAMDYVYNNLLGKTVILLPDSNHNTFEQIDGWVYKYVYDSPMKSVSEELLELGLAKVDSSFEKAEQYTDLLKYESMAKEEKLGIWYDYTSKDKGSVININTATSATLLNYLEDTTASMANSIVSYRYYNSYNTIEEIKFSSPYCTKEWFDKNKDKLSVVTDISSAGLSEISSLFNNTTLSNELAEKIIQYRLFNTISTIDEIKTIPGMTNYFIKMEKYMDLKPSNIYAPKDAKVVNINTASASQIRAVSSLSQYRSEKIVKERNNQNYIIKSIGELQKNGRLTKDEVDKYGDNFSIYTNINTALEHELKSLFGFINISTPSRDMIVKNIIKYRPYKTKYDLKKVIGLAYYNKLLPYIITSKSDIPEYININITDRDYAAYKLGMSSKDANYYKKTNIRYKSSTNITFDYNNFNAKFSLVTNLNSASKYEMENISSRIKKNNKYEYIKIPADIVQDILEFREDQPFVSLEEVSKIFSKHGKINIYNNIKDYIAFY